IMLETCWFDENLMEEIVANIKGEMDTKPILTKALKNAQKFFFISDIRSTSADIVGYAEKELNVHQDMKMQAHYGETLAAAVESKGVQFVASYKFRLPFILEIGGSNYEYGAGTLRC